MKNIIIKLARDAITNYLQTGKHLTAPDYIATSSGSIFKKKQIYPFLLEKKPCFVTLKQNGNLRGCIGNTYSDAALWKNIVQYAVLAATEDPRFNPLQPDDLDGLDIEVTVLGELVEIKNLEDFEIGKHGLIIMNKIQSGLFLPQIATEQGWDKKEFLEELSLKAGMDKGAYLDGNNKIFKFSAEIFND